jgi:hypothetical protein
MSTLYAEPLFLREARNHNSVLAVGPGIVAADSLLALSRYVEADGIAAGPEIALS